VQSKSKTKKLRKLSMEDFKEFVARGLLLFEREVKDLNILLFDEILEHIAKIDRILSIPGGSLLLVGKSGVGRRTAVELTTYIQGIELFSPNMPRGYSVKNFKQDLKQILQAVGVEGRQT